MNLLKYVRVQWDRTGAVLAAVVGLVALIFGYLGTSDTEYIAEQIPFIISGGLAAIVLFTVAGVLWLSADLRDEWRELAAQGEDLRAFMASETAKQSSERDG
ncbi:MAG TPA: hypothetical protein VMZ00_13870 [Sporichthya sp.]|nr:hypothetical protein [Sporichthya sp.]